MDSELAKYLAHADQIRSHLRSLLKTFPQANVEGFIRQCHAGQFGQMDQSARLLAGVLAVCCVLDLLQTDATKPLWWQKTVIDSWFSAKSMSPEVKALLREADPLRSQLRAVLVITPPADTALFIRNCASGQFERLDTEQRRWAGYMAVCCMFDLLQMRSEEV